MRKSVACLLLSVAAVVLGYFYNCVLAAPPLSLEGFLDEKLPEAAVDRPKMKVDNQSCYVCHDNYQEEELVVSHGVEDVGCVDCHGKSFAHRDDEDNITPPEIMYPRNKIDACCQDCHDMHDVSAADVIARWQERDLSKLAAKELVCTDCHGAHRLKRRMVRWDKQTGKLLEVVQKAASE